MAKNNKAMQAAKTNKNDEWYTRLEDIEDEISMHEDYVRQFEGKTVLCNCDDPEWSNFFLFFRLHFKQLKLKKVIFTHYEMNGSPSYKLEWDGSYIGYDTLNLIKTPLKGNGDFRSPECVEILKQADVVVTNPPFSLFREYIAQLVEYDKKFIIIGNVNAIAYKEVFPLIKDNKMWMGYSIHSGDREFRVPDDYPLSICQYVNGDFSLNSFYFHNLTETEKNQILDYKLMMIIMKKTLYKDNC